MLVSWLGSLGRRPLSPVRLLSRAVAQRQPSPPPFLPSSHRATTLSRRTRPRRLPSFLLFLLFPRARGASLSSLLLLLPRLFLFRLRRRRSRPLRGARRRRPRRVSRLSFLRAAAISLPLWALLVGFFFFLHMNDSAGKRERSLTQALPPGAQTPLSFMTRSPPGR